MADRRPTVLVTDAGYVPGLTVVRSLGRGGWRVVAAHPERQPRWSTSRYADRWFTVASPERDPDRAGVELATIVESERIDLVLPTTDKSIYVIDRDRSAFEPRTTLALPSTTALRTARDKGRTTTLADSLGLPTPTSCIARNLDEALRRAEAIGWPVVVKPLSSHLPDATGAIATRSVLHASDADELVDVVGSDRLGGFPLQIQAHIDGGGVGVELLMWQGETVAAFQHRRLHEVPLSGGMSSYRSAETPDPVLLDYSERLLGELGWDGLAMVEFKAGLDGPVFLEINGRVWGSIALPVRAGVDFPLLLAERYLSPDGRPPAGNELREGVTCRNLELELRWLTLAAKHRLAGDNAEVDLPPLEVSRTVAALLRPSTEFDAQVLDDWRPGLYNTLESVGGLLRSAVERTRPTR